MPWPLASCCQSPLTAVAPCHLHRSQRHCLPPSLLVDCCLTIAATVVSCLPLPCHWCQLFHHRHGQCGSGTPHSHHCSHCLHSSISTHLCHSHQWLIVDLLLSGVPCPLHCSPPSLVIRRLLHHFPSLHRSHQWLVVVFCWSSLTHFVALSSCCCWLRPPPQHVSNVRVSCRNSLARWPFPVPMATKSTLMVAALATTHFCPWAIATMQ